MFLTEEDALAECVQIRGRLCPRRRPPLGFRYWSAIRPYGGKLSIIDKACLMDGLVTRPSIDWDAYDYLECRLGLAETLLDAKLLVSVESQSRWSR